jgi:hypothetical protein
MSDDAAPLSESFDSADLAVSESSSPTTPHGATEQQLEDELIQQETGLKESDPGLYAQIEQEKETALASDKKDPAQASETDERFLTEAAQQVAQVDPTLGRQMEAEVAAYDALATHADPPAQVTQTTTQTSSTSPTVLEQEAQFIEHNPSVVAQIKAIETAAAQEVAANPGMAANIEQQADQEILRDVAEVDLTLASTLEGELEATAQELNPAALAAEEQRIQEQLTAPQTERGQTPVT